MASLTPVQSTMFDLETSTDSPSVTGSPASASGVTRSDSQESPTTGNAGQEVAPAALSRRPASAKRKTTRGTFGQSGFLSSKHEDLSARLANRYRALTASAGSTMYALTWTQRITPLGFSIPAQRGRARRIFVKDCIGVLGWPTPNLPSGGPNAKSTEKHTGGMDLEGAATLAGWPTPTACSPNSLRGKSQDPAKRAEGGHSINLQDIVTLCGWNTPRATDGSNGGPNQAGGALSADVAMCGWATPQSRDHFPAHTDEYVASKMAQGHGMQNLNDQVTLTGWATPNVPNGGRISGNPEDKDGTKAQIGLENQARLTASGPGPIGYLLGRNGWEIVPASGQLHPAFSLWLQGLPAVFWDCVEPAMRSMPSKRRGSSARGSKKPEASE